MAPQNESKEGDYSPDMEKGGAGEHGGRMKIWRGRPRFQGADGQYISKTACMDSATMLERIINSKREIKSQRAICQTKRRERQ